MDENQRRYEDAINALQDALNAATVAAFEVRNASIDSKRKGAHRKFSWLRSEQSLAAVHLAAILNGLDGFIDLLRTNGLDA